MTICGTCRLEQPCDCVPGERPRQLVVPPRTFAERHVRPAPHRVTREEAADAVDDVLRALERHDRTRTGHPAVLARNDLLDLAILWPVLLTLLAPAAGGDGGGVHTVPHSTVLIETDVSQVVADVSTWARHWAHTLTVATDWPPPRHLDDPRTVGVLLRELADHVGALTERGDQAATLFPGECDAMRERVRRTIMPPTRRAIRLHLRCEEHTTTDLGERVPCPGYLFTVLDTDKPGVRGDVLCSRDPTHRITPDEWNRAYRRRANDARAAAALVAAIHEGERRQAERVRMHR